MTTSVSLLKFQPSPERTMLRSCTFSPSSIWLPDLTRAANSWHHTFSQLASLPRCNTWVPASLRNSPISDTNWWPPPLNMAGLRCSTLQHNQCYTTAGFSGSPRQHRTCCPATTPSHLLCNTVTV